MFVCFASLLSSSRSCSSIERHERHTLTHLSRSQKTQILHPGHVLIFHEIFEFDNSNNDSTNEWLAKTHDFFLAFFNIINKIFARAQNLILMDTDNFRSFWSDMSFLNYFVIEFILLSCVSEVSITRSYFQLFGRSFQVNDFNNDKRNHKQPTSRQF